MLLQRECISPSEYTLYHGFPATWLYMVPPRFSIISSNTLRAMFSIMSKQPTMISVQLYVEWKATVRLLDRTLSSDTSQKKRAQAGTCSTISCPFHHQTLKQSLVIILQCCNKNVTLARKRWVIRSEKVRRSQLDRAFKEVTEDKSMLNLKLIRAMPTATLQGRKYSLHTSLKTSSSRVKFDLLWIGDQISWIDLPLTPTQITKDLLVLHEATRYRWMQ